MRIPYRKPGKFSQLAPDPALTPNKLLELENKLERLKKSRPQAAAEVSRLAELGDFSENVEYQLAKGRLRGINNTILSLESQINRAAVIPTPAQTNTVTLGHTVTIESAGEQKTYRILGSSETDPSRGIISQHSPIGSALLDRRVGETITIKLAGKETDYKIIKIF